MQGKSRAEVPVMRWGHALGHNRNELRNAGSAATSALQTALPTKGLVIHFEGGVAVGVGETNHRNPLYAKQLRPEISFHYDCG
jgi:hypothetical protein